MIWQQRASWALGRAAAVAGTPYAHYRPAGHLRALTSCCRLPDLPVLFTRGANRTLDPGIIHWEATLDSSLLAIGDYLVGSGKSYFIATADLGRSALALETTDEISIFAAGEPSGALPGGFDFDTAVAVAIGWPAALIRSGRTTNGGDVCVRGVLPRGLPTVWPGMVVVNRLQQVF